MYELKQTSGPDENGWVEWTEYLEGHENLKVYTYPFSGQSREGSEDWYFEVQMDGEYGWAEWFSHEPNGPSEFKTEVQALYGALYRAHVEEMDL